MPNPGVLAYLHRHHAFENQRFSSPRRLSFQPITASVDLADSPSASGPNKPSPDPLSIFHYFGPLRHKLELIQRLASPVPLTVPLTSPPSPDVVNFLERLELLPQSLQRLIVGLKPTLLHYAPEFMVSLLSFAVILQIRILVRLMRNKIALTYVQCLSKYASRYNTTKTPLCALSPDYKTD